MLTGIWRVLIHAGRSLNWLDLKLGGRMLVKYPGLTIVGGLAMSFAIWAGIAARFAYAVPLMTVDGALFCR